MQMNERYIMPMKDPVELFRSIGVPEAHLQLVGTFLPITSSASEDVLQVYVKIDASVQSFKCDINYVVN